MSEEQFDNDVVKMELPEYEESSFPFPDVRAESSFAENKDEIFRRNMIIAAKEAKLPVQREKFPENFGTEEIFPWDKQSPGDKRPEKIGIFRRAATILDNSQGLKIIYSMLLVTFVVVMTILLSLTFQLRGREKTPALDIKLSPMAETVVTVQYEEVVTGTEIVQEQPLQEQQFQEQPLQEQVTEVLEEQVTEVIPDREVTVTLTEVSVLN